MMKLSRTIGYAIHATLDLARRQSEFPIPCSVIARSGELPPRFLVQILRQLVKKGILKSTPGISGGYCLNRVPEQITLLEIVEAFEDALTPVVPGLIGFSPNVRGRLMLTLEQSARAARTEMNKLTLADLKEQTNDCERRRFDALSRVQQPLFEHNHLPDSLTRVEEGD